MIRMLQIRNVPEELHRQLKARAALEGLSLSDYLLEELRRAAAVPTAREIRERLLQREPVEVHESIVDALRAEREGR